MRLRSILSEAMRNVGAGNAHALALFVAMLLGGMLLGGSEAYTVGAMEHEAMARVQAMADVDTVVGGTVDGGACDRLAQSSGGPIAQSGAVRTGDEITPLSTPNNALQSFVVTQGMLSLIASNGAVASPIDTSGIWVSTDKACCRSSRRTAPSPHRSTRRGSGCRPMLRVTSGSRSAPHWPRTMAMPLWRVSTHGPTMGVTPVSLTRSLCHAPPPWATTTSAGYANGRVRNRRATCCTPRCVWAMGRTKLVWSRSTRVSPRTMTPTPPTWRAPPVGSRSLRRFWALPSV